MWECEYHFEIPISTLLGEHPEAELPDQRAVLFSMFSETSAPICTPPAVQEGSNGSTASPTLSFGILRTAVPAGVR